MGKSKKVAGGISFQQDLASQNETENGIAFNMPKDMSVGIIKVIGVGGGGCNAVRNMWLEGIENVTYAVTNTDSQQLARCPVPVRLQLGNDGLGAGGNPEKGREEAEHTRELIRELLSDGTKMAFITASMGGGTGTGAAPIIAQVAKEMGILTIGIVTIPFAFEGKQKILKALRGMEEMRKSVDALLVVQNDKLTGGNSKMVDGERRRIPVKDKFKEADNVLKDAAKSISELITLHTEGDINLDFRDVETTMKNGGDAIMAAGRASGEHRVERAIMQALDSPLLYGSDIGRAQRILFDIYTSEEEPLYIDEMDDIDDFMHQLDPDIEVIWGTSTDNSLGQDAKVIILAAGMAGQMRTEAKTGKSEEKDDEYFLTMMKRLYEPTRTPVRTVLEGVLPFKEDEEKPEENETKPAEETTQSSAAETTHAETEVAGPREPQAEEDETTDDEDETPDDEDETENGNVLGTFVGRAKAWLSKFGDMVNEGS